MIKVLVIGDHIPSMDSIGLILTPAGFEVQTADASSAELGQVDKWHPDVIILDMLQPAGNGWQDCQTIHKRCNAPILVLSVANNPHIVAQALDGGADDYLCKPVQAEILIAHINTLARRTCTGQLSS